MADNTVDTGPMPNPNDYLAVTDNGIIVILLVYAAFYFIYKKW